MLHAITATRLTCPLTFVALSKALYKPNTETKAEAETGGSKN